MAMADFPFSFQPHESGLRTVLGDLETDIMEVLWHTGPMTVREVYRKLRPRRKIAYTTVMTVMARLAEKGLLTRDKEGKAFRYNPAQTREAFQQTVVGKIIRGLLGGFGTPAISFFVDTIDKERPETMEELARLIEKKRGGSHD